MLVHEVMVIISQWTCLSAHPIVHPQYTEFYLLIILQHAGKMLTHQMG